MSLTAVYPHRIRLRGPWECTPLPEGGIETYRVIMPCGWIEASLSEFRGKARFSRKFGYPGRVDESEHVWLTCDGVTGCTAVRLNGERLTDQPCTAFSFDVTPILTLRNCLEIEINGDVENAGLWGEVAMEIRKGAFLADVILERNELSGNVIGFAPQPLELYTLVDSRHVDYRTIEPTSAGQAFRIELPTSPTKMVRVELIHISSIWYVVEIAGEGSR